MKKHPAIPLLALCLAAWAPPASASDASRLSKEDPVLVDASQPEEIKRLEAWPTPTKEAAKTLKTDLARLRKASTPEMGVSGRAGIITLGDLAVPALIKALGKEKKEDARERIIDALMELTGAPHTRLLAKKFNDRSEHVRMFVLERVATFPDGGVRAAAEAAFKAAKQRAGTKKAIKHELFFSALVLTSSGSFDGLDELYKRSLKHWGKSGHSIRNAIEALRGPIATKLIAAKLEAGNRKSTVAVLRLLAGCGDLQSAKAIVGPFLDNTDNSIRVAAINALRGVVDGEKPLDKLPVFEAVERANKWKTRL